MQIIIIIYDRFKRTIKNYIYVVQDLVFTTIVIKICMRKIY